MRCRILFVIGQLGARGLERQFVYLLGDLDRARHRPEVVVWNFSERDEYVPAVRAMGVPLHAAPAGSRLAKVAWFRRLTRRLRPEVVHSCSFYTNLAAQLGASACGAVAVGSIRSNYIFDRAESGRVLGTLSSRWPRIQICNNAAAVENSRAYAEWSRPRKMIVVRNGLDLARFRADPPVGAGAGAGAGTVEIAAVGGLVPVKRWDRLLRAAGALQQRGLNFRIRLVGEGPLRPELERQARDLGVDGRVVFHGKSSDIPARLAEADFLVHTSDAEGCPNVVMEALACGRAVVATDAGDTAALVENGKTGFIVACGDEAALAERMAALIGDRDLRLCLGAAGRAKAEREFGLDRLLRETLDAYRVAGWRAC